MVSRFDEELPLVPNPPKPRTKLGACAMGDVAPGRKITWMRVWVWQKVGDRVALSSGTSGEHLNKKPVDPREKRPFTPKKGWMVQTRLEPGSKQFTKGKPALATALALVQDKNGDKDIEHWSQAVVIRDGLPTDYDYG